MQYRLSTLFLIFFVVAATLALFEVWGIAAAEGFRRADVQAFFGVLGLWVAGVLCLAAFCLNRAKTLTRGIAYALLVVWVGIVCTGLMLPMVEVSREAARQVNCINNMKQIGLGLFGYENANKHFPPIYTCDKEGKPLRSWLVEILPYMEYDSIYNRLNKEEPWNSPLNAQILPHAISEYICPSANRDVKDCSSNYMAITGPGTIWKADGTKKISDLANGSSNSIVAVEVVDSGKHWAEPLALTVDEVLENMKTGKGVRISCGHTNVVNVLFADGTVRRLFSDMPLSLWRKILDGEVTDFDNLFLQIDPDAPDMVDVHVEQIFPGPGKWTIILSILVWLISVVWLFYRAVKSRKIIPQALPAAA
jgi:prepilin-type processing-associated H-X9-DG protein